MHCRQYGYSSRYLNALVRTNELFGVYSKVPLSEFADTSVTLGEGTSTFDMGPPEGWEPEEGVGARVASIVFAVMTAAQLARLIIDPEVLVAGHRMPLWPSALAVIFFAALSIWLWKLSREAVK